MTGVWWVGKGGDKGGGLRKGMGREGKWGGEGDGEGKVGGGRIREDKADGERRRVRDRLRGLCEDFERLPAEGVHSKVQEQNERLTVEITALRAKLLESRNWIERSKRDSISHTNSKTFGTFLKALVEDPAP